jgi:hypothetical protein
MVHAPRDHSHTEEASEEMSRGSGAKTVRTTSFPWKDGLVRCEGPVAAATAPALGVGE